MSSRFLRACRREPTDATPVWFMRQAGRYLPEYRALRGRYSLLELCQTPELAAEATLQPVRRLGVDAAILFSDLLLPFISLGVPFEYAKGEGPVVLAPVRSHSDVDRLTTRDPRETLAYVFETIRLVRQDLDERVPLIGFGGAPFTLASYLVEGGPSSQYARTKGLMYAEPATWHQLCEKLVTVVGEFLHAQIDAGVDAVQVFDSWVGALSPRDYREFVQPHSRRLLESLEARGVPVIHFGTGTATLLDEMRAAGGTVIGLDWRIPLDEAWARIGYDRAVQGNLDPSLLLGTLDRLLTGAEDVLRRAGGRPGHIFNVGHGLLPETPVEHVQALVDFVHRYRHR